MKRLSATRPVASLRTSQNCQSCCGDGNTGLRAVLFLFTSSQHFIDACDELPGVLDRSLALLDLCQEALTFFLRFFDQRG